MQFSDQLEWKVQNLTLLILDYISVFKVRRDYITPFLCINLAFSWYGLAFKKLDKHNQESLYFTITQAHGSGEVQKTVLNIC